MTDPLPQSEKTPNKYKYLWNSLSSIIDEVTDATQRATPFRGSGEAFVVTRTTLHIKEWLKEHIAKAEENYDESVEMHQADYLAYTYIQNLIDDMTIVRVITQDERILKGIIGSQIKGAFTLRTSDGQYHTKLLKEVKLIIPVEGQ